MREKDGGEATFPVTTNRRYPIGAELNGNGVSFRVWAPARTSVTLVLNDGIERIMAGPAGGYFQLDISGLSAGTLYQYRLDDIPTLAPDPASRFQPEGPEGPSMVVNPDSFVWHDGTWPGLKPHGQVVYEMHIGTFTLEGSLNAATQKLPLLQEIGITCLEVMPLNEFMGGFGWGYDGVLPYAPTHLYGQPDDLRKFVDTAHGLGIGVILDVVYNHFGAGERFSDFTPSYFTDRYRNEWGRSINFDGPGSAGVREFVSKNAAYWIDEYHLDGLRLDATQALYDSGPVHIMELIAREARLAGQNRSIYLVAENEPQDTRLVRQTCSAGYDLDAVWNDDFHHSAMVALTGRNEAYYHDFSGHAQEFVSAAKYGYLFQGQRSDWQNAPRGQPGFDLKPTNYIHFLQNHDQIANSGTGGRLDTLAAPARLRALTALLLLGPQTPMMFQGQEFGASSPFFYFADQGAELADIVRDGRIASLMQFPSLRDEAFVRRMPPPTERSTFERCQLDWNEYDAHRQQVALHRDLIALRRARLSRQGSGHGRIDGSVLGASTLLLRYFAELPEDEQLLIVNLGADRQLGAIADPLFAPPAGLCWAVEWSSEDPAYGGIGRRPVDLQRRWTLSSDCALLMSTTPTEPVSSPDQESLKLWQESISSA